MEEEIMNNDEVIREATEEIVKATSRSGLKTVTAIGLAMIAGGLACKFIVEPAIARFKNWRANRVYGYSEEIIDSDDFNVTVETETSNESE